VWISFFLANNTLQFIDYSRKDHKNFTFDHCFWSLDPNDEDKYSSQEKVFEALGQDLLENAFQGYNACIFAYGQTGNPKLFICLNKVFYCNECACDVYVYICNIPSIRTAGTRDILTKSCFGWLAHKIMLLFA